MLVLTLSLQRWIHIIKIILLIVEMIKMIKTLIFCTLSVVLFGCASDKLNANTANLIYMSNDRAPSDCKFVGKINVLHETVTTGINPHLGKNLSQGHVLAAKKMGANYIEMNEDQTAEAYSCPNSELIKIDKHNWNN